MDSANIDKNKLAGLEALLFIYGEPIETKKLAKILELNESDLGEYIALFENELAREERGLSIVQDKGRIQLVTKSIFSKLLEAVTKQEFAEALTPAALETLSIIAYAGPISRADIEYIRGVNSSFILRMLVMRGLVEREINPKRANAYVYSASFDLLRYLGLSKAADLPDHDKYKDLVSRLYQELEQKDKKQENSGASEAMMVMPEQISPIEQKSQSQQEQPEPQILQEIQEQQAAPELKKSDLPVADSLAETEQSNEIVETEQRAIPPENQEPQVGPEKDSML